MEYGILYIDLHYNKIIQKKTARRCTHDATIEIMCGLRKCCLQEIARNFKVARDQPKPYLALDIQRSSNNYQLKQILKDVVVREKYSHSHNNKISLL